LGDWGIEDVSFGPLCIKALSSARRKGFGSIGKMIFFEITVKAFDLGAEKILFIASSLSYCSMGSRLGKRMIWFPLYPISVNQLV
jgi:hypothetical protein